MKCMFRKARSFKELSESGHVELNIHARMCDKIAVGVRVIDGKAIDGLKHLGEVIGEASVNPMTNLSILEAKRQLKFPDTPSGHYSNQLILKSRS